MPDWLLSPELAKLTPGKAIQATAASAAAPAPAPRAIRFRFMSCRFLRLVRSRAHVPPGARALIAEGDRNSYRWRRNEAQMNHGPFDGLFIGRRCEWRATAAWPVHLAAAPAMPRLSAPPAPPPGPPDRG